LLFIEVILFCDFLNLFPASLYLLMLCSRIDLLKDSILSTFFSVVSKEISFFFTFSTSCWASGSFIPAFIIFSAFINSCASVVEGFLTS